LPTSVGAPAWAPATDCCAAGVLALAWPPPAAPVPPPKPTGAAAPVLAAAALGVTRAAIAAAAEPSKTPRASAITSQMTHSHQGRGAPTMVIFWVSSSGCCIVPAYGLPRRPPMRPDGSSRYIEDAECMVEVG